MQTPEKNASVFRAASDASTREGRKSPAQNSNADLFFAAVFVLIVAGLLAFILYHAGQP